MSRPRPLHLAVDGDNLSHRVFHASGRNRNDAAFLNLLRHCAARVTELVGRPVTHLLVAFDSSSNHRRDRYPDYKASRPARDPDLDDQMTACRQALSACGVAVHCVEGFEADDVLASHAAAIGPDGHLVVVSSDRDLLALVSDHVSLLRLTGSVADATLLDPAGVARAYGVTPSQYLDLAALRGDPSDDLPGVAGIGAKSAAALLTDLGSVAAALADPDAARAAIGARARHLEAGREVHGRNVEIMRLVDDLDLGPPAPLSAADVPADCTQATSLAALLDACRTSARGTG